MMKIMLLLFSFFLLSGCRKAFVPPTVVFLKDGLAYIQLSDGQHYVYKDSATGRLDTMLVTTSSLQTIREPVNKTGKPPYG